MNPNAYPDLSEPQKVGQPPKLQKTGPYPNFHQPNGLYSTPNPYQPVQVHFPERPQQGAYRGAYAAPHTPPGQYNNRGYQGYGLSAGYTSQADQLHAVCTMCLPVCTALTCCCLCLQ